VLLGWQQSLADDDELLLMVTIQSLHCCSLQQHYSDNG
jgi:hypothetical protein